MPAISVLMPAYNAATYIAQAIDSILQQTFRDFELIIVNDGSTDRTEDIVLSYQDNRIRYFKNDGNKGLIYTRNKLVELSSANFIAFLDSDDLSMNTRLERQYAKFAADERLSFVSTSFYMINEYGEIVNRDNFYDLNSEELKSTFLFLNPVATSSSRGSI